jgi:hypothetical protein
MQGAYIPLVLQENSQQASYRDHSYGSLGYHSFGNADHMGRRTPTLSPTGSHSIKQATLEREGSSKGGAGLPGVHKDQGTQGKAFV